MLTSQGRRPSGIGTSRAPGNDGARAGDLAAELNPDPIRNLAYRPGALRQPLSPAAEPEGWGPRACSSWWPPTQDHPGRAAPARARPNWPRGLGLCSDSPPKLGSSASFTPDDGSGCPISWPGARGHYGQDQPVLGDAELVTVAVIRGGYGKPLRLAGHPLSSYCSTGDQPRRETRASSMAPSSAVRACPAQRPCRRPSQDQGLCHTPDPGSPAQSSSPNPMGWLDCHVQASVSMTSRFRSARHPSSWLALDGSASEVAMSPLRRPITS